MTATMHTTSHPLAPTCSIHSPEPDFISARTQADALCLADRAVVSDIEMYADPVKSEQPGRWYDVAILLSEHDYCADSIEMHLQALRYATARRLVVAHPSHPTWVRIHPRMLEGAASAEAA